MTSVIVLDEYNNALQIRVMTIFTTGCFALSLNWEYQREKSGERRNKMWIFRYTYCLFNGHAYIDITSTQRSYRYCLHCGDIKEPTAQGIKVTGAGSSEAQPGFVISAINKSVRYK
jgi:hypothetical protein